MIEPTMDSRPAQEYSLDALPASLRGCVLTIGNFDGVHVGHRRILATARSLGDSLRAPVAAMTFEPPPDRVLRPSDAPRRLVPPEVKRALLIEAGADAVVTARVDAAFLAMTAEEFVERIVLEKFGARHVVEGPSFFFGRGRSGDLEFLRRAGRRHGFEVHAVEPVLVEMGARRQRVSSSLIRRRLLLGDVQGAARCLGRPFALYGRIVRGQGRGRTLGFPTVNLETQDQIVPGNGVYAGWADIEGRAFPAAISVGRSATFGPAPLTVEAFLLDAEGDFHDKDMALEFLHRLRGQQRFDGAESLRAQIARDVERVRELLR
jgi:riboflavin kinase/FMN adenylyltransferase